MPELLRENGDENHLYNVARDEGNDCDSEHLSCSFVRHYAHEVYDSESEENYSAENDYKSRDDP